MIYLNWAEASIPLEHTQHSELKSQLTLKLRGEELQALIQKLMEAFPGMPVGASDHLNESLLNYKEEFRLSLPQGWSIYWKQREEGNRALLAHPEADEWVGTIALEESAGEKLISAMKNLEPEQSLIVGKQITWASMSNLEVKIFRRP